MDQNSVFDHPSRRLRDAIEPIAMHPVWSPRTRAALGELGLSRLSGYVWSRAAALGEASPSVVTAAFAVFEPGWVHRAIREGVRVACGRDTLLETRAAATTKSLHAVLDGEDVTDVAMALQGAVAGADGTGRPLFSGLADLTWSDDPVEVLWRSCEMAREHRGDSHVAVCVAANLSPVAMNILTELWLGMEIGSYTATRGWSADQIAGTAEELRVKGLIDGERLSDAGRAFRSEIEDRTNLADNAIVAALGSDAEAMIAHLDGWSQLCIEADTFTDDADKRAAG